MANTKDMMRIPGVASRVVFGARQADWGWFVNIRCRPCERRDPYAVSLDLTKDVDEPTQPKGQRRMGPCVRRDDGERGFRERYTEAVVTPPSTTMVCPVMKLEASEPR